MRNSSRPAQSFVFRALLSIGVVVLGTAGLKIFYLSLVIRNDAALSVSRASLYIGMLMIDVLAFGGIGGFLWKYYESSVRRPLSDITDRIQHMQIASEQIRQTEQETECDDVNALCSAAANMLRRLTMLKY